MQQARFGRFVTPLSALLRLTMTVGTAAAVLSLGLLFANSVIDMFKNAISLSHTKEKLIPQFTFKRDTGQVETNTDLLGRPLIWLPGESLSSVALAEKVETIHESIVRAHGITSLIVILLPESSKNTSDQLSWPANDPNVIRLTGRTDEVETFWTSIAGPYGRSNKSAAYLVGAIGDLQGSIDLGVPSPIVESKVKEFVTKNRSYLHPE